MNDSSSNSQLNTDITPTSCDQVESLKNANGLEQIIHEKEKEIKRLEIQIKYEIDEKNKAIELAQYEEKIKNEQIETRRLYQCENEKLTYEMNQITTENKKLKQELEEEMNKSSEFEAKFLVQTEEKDRIKVELEQRLEIEHSKRIESEKEKISEIKKKEKEIIHSESSDKQNQELIQKLYAAKKEVIIYKEQYESEKLKSEKLKSENEAQNGLNEEKIRQNFESEKFRIEDENLQIKKENEKFQQEIVKMKELIESEKAVNQIISIDNKENQCEQEIQSKKESIESIQKRQVGDIVSARNKNKQELDKEKEQQNKALSRSASQKSFKGASKIQSVLSEATTISIRNLDVRDIDFVDADGQSKKIVKKKSRYNTISFEPVLGDSVWSLEAQFQNTDKMAAIGIVRDSYNIPVGACPMFIENTQHMAVYLKQSWGQGQINYKNKSTEGNSGFDDNQIIKLEYDSKKGKLAFFLNGQQQPVSVEGIKEKVRFIVFMNAKGSNCIIRSLKKLTSPTAGNVKNAKVVVW